MPRAISLALRSVAHRLTAHRGERSVAIKIMKKIDQSGEWASDRCATLPSMADFRKEFERVRSQVVMGNAHLELWRSLSKRLFADPKRPVANVAPAFFGMTLEAHLNTAILHAARIFDTHRGVLNLENILRRANASKGTLSPQSAHDLTENLREARAKLPKLKSTLEAVRIRRNKTLAHLDPKVVSKPEEIEKKSELTVEQLEKLFATAWEILNGVSVPYWDLSASLKLIGVDDYELALDYIEKEKKRILDEYEAEFGPFPHPTAG